MAEGQAPERWQLIDSLFEQALELEVGARQAFLEQACSGDDDLKSELEGLLEVADSSPAFLEEGALALATPFLSDLEGLQEPTPPGLEERLGFYRIVSEIGSGGMSRVYLAERDDGEFVRQVAIKVMDTGGAERLEFEQRFRTERQILATFDHPAIASVFDGGVTDDGRPYLVMDFVIGQALTSYCEQHELGLEGRLELFHQVCGAVHYAHQRLVVHRDLKPANILVTEEGRVKLLDFGIAKLLDREASEFEMEMPATRTGLLLLTPEYAAPEQLQSREVTTATDIYALGVLLYQLLVGRRPFQLAGLAPHEIANVVCEREPKKPSSAMRQDGGSTSTESGWQPSRLVGDLDTMVLKALRKQPQKRYGSAKELADEVERFLAGEPIAARPVGTVERLIRKVRRHPRASVVTSLALALFSVLGALALHARSTARAQAIAAQRFGQEVERIEAMLQRAYMAPLHDIRPELDEVRARMGEIRDQMAGRPEASRAIADYALGRGHLGLGEEDTARVHLERAWEAGYQEPRVAYALGLTLSRLYRSALSELAPIRSEAVRAARLAQIEKEFRDPSVRALQAAGQEAYRADFVAASLDFFAGRSEQALQRLESQSGAESWFYESDLLAGDIFSELRRTAAAAGRAEEADQHQQRAVAAFDRAVEMARSDPRGYEGLCNLRSDLLSELYYSSLDGFADVRNAASGSCNLAVAADPESPHAHLRLGQVERLWASHRADQGDDPRPLLEAALAQLERAADLAPQNARPWVVQGAVFRTIATYLSSRGQDPTQAYSAALERYDRATEIDPSDYDAHVSRSLTELYLGDFERRRGGAAEGYFENAVASARRAVDLLPVMAGAHVNLGIAYEQLAVVRRDRSAEALSLFEAGANALRRAMEINPGYVIAQFNMGELLLERGELELINGEDPTASVEAARPLLSKALAAWPEYAPTYLIRALSEALLVRWKLASGGSPDQELADALRWVEQGTALSISEPEVFCDAARVYLLQARWQVDRGQRSEAAVSHALRYLGRALDMHPQLGTANQLIAEAHWLQARTLRGGQDPREVLELGLGAARRALEENPTDFESHLQIARLELRWASWLEVSGGDPSRRVFAARTAAEKTLELRPGYPPAEKVLRQLTTP